MTDLLVSVHTPTIDSGRGLRTYTVARALAAAGDGVAILYVRFGAASPDAPFRAIPGVALHEVVASRDFRRLTTYLGARLQGVPHGFARGISHELQEVVERLAAEHRGRVIADGPVAAAAIAPRAHRQPFIYNAHNLESGFRHSLDTRGIGSPKALRAFERRILRAASESWMVSEADAAAARGLCPEARIRVVPNVVDAEAIEPVTPAPRARRAVFVGSFDYEPNRAALRFLLEEVFPRVWRELHDARLRVVGGGLDGPPSDDPRVEAVGFVDDVTTAYSGASCALVPLLHGGGTPLKFIEALAYGVPVVATPQASRGLAVRDGVHCALAEGADEFASALVRVLRAGGAELARNGRALALEQYSIEALIPRVIPG